MLAVITSGYQISNYIEAMLWCAVAAMIALLARKWQGPAKLDAWGWSIVLIAFGASDVVEASTGAWWRPWWLLAWKAACLAGMLVLLLRWHSRRR